jgi:hypothetical protein
VVFVTDILTLEHVFRFSLANYHSIFIGHLLSAMASSERLYEHLGPRVSVSPQALKTCHTHLVVVVPEDVGRWLWAVLDCAREVNGTAFVHVQVRASQNRCSRYCKKKRRKNIK